MITFKRIVAVYFSPTHTTQKVVKAIASGLEIDAIIELDLTTKTENNFNAQEGDIVLIGTPVHNGRIPSIAKERIQHIQGSGQPVICVSVFGNRGFGNALIELSSFMEKNGFVTIGASGFIGEHSFATKKQKIAEGRPNENDLKLAYDFGAQIRKKISGAQIMNINTLAIKSKIPGKNPTRPAVGMPKMQSKPTEDCVNCKICIDVCPTGAIADDLSCDSKKCISCFACVKSCPHGARALKHPMVSVVAYALSKQKDKEPRIFM